LGHTCQHAHSRAHMLGEAAEDNIGGDAGTENCELREVETYRNQHEGLHEIIDSLHRIPRAAKEYAITTWLTRVAGPEKRITDAVRHEVDAVLALPAARHYVVPIGGVQQNRTICEPNGGRDLGQPRRRIPEAARPAFVRNAGGVIVEHALIVEMFEPIGPVDEPSVPCAEQRTTQTQYVAFGARDIDD